MSISPLSEEEYATLVTYELDVNSPLGIAILSERWINMEQTRQLFWLQVLAYGVINCGVTVCPSREQIEIEVELEPGQSVAFCITLARFERFS